MAGERQRHGLPVEADAQREAPTAPGFALLRARLYGDADPGCNTPIALDGAAEVRAPRDERLLAAPSLRAIPGPRGRA